MILRQPTLSLRYLAPALQPPCPSSSSPSSTTLGRRPRALAQRRPFTTTLPRHDNNSPPPNHYEVMKVPPNATKAEIKKQFYDLSKETHPDRHPNDPKAGERFAMISESYSVLANDEKRRRYDRDVMRTTQQHRRPGTGEKDSMGSYAGSRPPSGLSRRRSAFKGPPPSYYAHGNPSARTSAAGSQHSSTSSSSTNHHQHHQHHPKGGHFNASAYTEAGQYDPYFNAEPVYRTQSHEDRRRTSRQQAEMARAQAEVDDEGNFWARFVILTSVVVLTLTVGSLVVNAANVPRGGGGGGGPLRSDGSRRDGPRNEWTKG